MHTIYIEALWFELTYPPLRTSRPVLMSRHYQHFWCPICPRVLERMEVYVLVGSADFPDPETLMIPLIQVGIHGLPFRDGSPNQHQT